MCDYVQAISKAEFIKILKSKTGFTQTGLDVVLSAFAETLRTEVLENGKEIRLRDFGTFKLRQSSARVGRNPKTGEELTISASKAVTFSASASLKNKDDGEGDDA